MNSCNYKRGPRPPLQLALTLVGSHEIEGGSSIKYSIVDFGILDQSESLSALLVGLYLHVQGPASRCGPNQAEPFWVKLSQALVTA